MNFSKTFIHIFNRMAIWNTSVSRIKSFLSVGRALATSIFYCSILNQFCCIDTVKNQIYYDKWLTPYTFRLHPKIMPQWIRPVSREGLRLFLNVKRIGLSSSHLPTDGYTMYMLRARMEEQIFFITSLQ